MTSDLQARSRRVTLIDVTVACAALVTVALILTPSIADIVNDSRVARAQSDCNAIANAIVRFHKDAGFFPQWARGRPHPPNEPRERLVLLTGPGNTPGGETRNRALQGWLIPSGQLATGGLADHLIANTPVYPLRGPSTQIGWGGPYLSAPVGPDPWNNRYMVNVGATDATGGRENAVFAISAGPNGIIETPFTQPLAPASLSGDDIGQRIR